jgi:hypothetical protein
MTSLWNSLVLALKIEKLMMPQTIIRPELRRKNDPGKMEPLNLIL